MVLIANRLYSSPMRNRSHAAVTREWNLTLFFFLFLLPIVNGEVNMESDANVYDYGCYVTLNKDIRCFKTFAAGPFRRFV